MERLGTNTSLLCQSAYSVCVLVCVCVCVIACLCRCGGGVYTCDSATVCGCKYELVLVMEHITCLRTNYCGNMPLFPTTIINVYEVRAWIVLSGMICMENSHQIYLCNMETSFTNPGSSSTSDSDAPRADVLADAGGEDPAKLRLIARASSSSSLSCVVGGD